MKDRQAARARRGRSDRRRAAADDQERGGAIELRSERRAQRPGRQHAAVADAARDRPRGSTDPSRATGFWNPSSITMTLAPRSLARRAPATRFARDDRRARRARAAAARRRPARRVCAALDRHRSGKPPAIAARQEHRPLAGRDQHAARSRSPSASCRRRRRSDCRRRSPECRRARPAAPAAARRCAVESPRAVRAARCIAPGSRHQKPGARMRSAPLQIELHQIRLDRRERAAQRAAELVDGLKRRRRRPACAAPRRSATRRCAPPAD